jgi:hypothetical protein
MVGAGYRFTHFLLVSLDCRLEIKPVLENAQVVV